MEYRRFENTLVVRLDRGEEICQKVLELAERENISLASVAALGAVGELTVGVFDPASKKYAANEFSGKFEIVSLTGTLSVMDKKPYLHLHMSVGDERGSVFGGHLNRAVVSATCEMVINIIPGEVGRVFDPDVGLNLFKF